MRKSIILSIVSVFLTITASTQINYRIDFNVKNYNQDTLVLGYYFADRQLVKDTIIRSKDNSFLYETEDTLVSGVYLLLTQPDNEYMQIMINENERDFKVELDVKDLGNPKFSGSEDNKAFYEYLNFLNKLKPKAEKLRATVKEKEADGKDTSKEQKELDELDKEVKTYQMDVITKYPSTVTSLLIASNISMDVPDFEGSPIEISKKRYEFYRENYLANVDLSNPISLHLPSTDSKIDTYIKKLTIQHPDSIKQSLDYLLQKMEGAEKTFRYYITKFINEYANPKQVGFDAVYVHLADNYYAKGKTPWTTEENLKKIMNEARGLRPVLIGKTAPDLTLFKQDGTPVVLSEIDADYKVLIFWAPSCPHCSKAMPPLVKFYEKYKDRGVEVISICTKSGKKLKGCWDALEKKGMGQFLNLGDEIGRSRFKSKYYVKQTPKIYVLDKDLKILVKDIGSDQLDQLMGSLMESAENDQNIGG